MFENHFITEDAGDNENEKSMSHHFWAAGDQGSAQEGTPCDWSSAVAHTVVKCRPL